MSWTAKRTNQWVLEKAGVSSNKEKEAHLLWVYHEETRQPGEGHYNGDSARKKRARGRPKTSWMNDWANVKCYT